DWPLEAIVPDREAFFAFLQERWPAYLDAVAAAPEAICEPPQPPHFELPGPATLPFGDDDVRVYIDNLFADGVLRPVAHRRASALQGRWVAVGLRLDPQADRARQLDALFKALEGGIPPAQASYQAWLALAPRLAQLLALWHSPAAPAPQAGERLAALQAQLDAAFLAWAQARYGGLHNQPVPPAVMLHHVPRVMAARLQRPGGKAALVVVDGLACDQWLLLRQALEGARPRLRLREGAVFAWLPTITAVSRQALFAGRPPLYFPASLHTTAKEPALWSQFWQDAGLAPTEVAYVGGLGELPDLARVEELLAHPKLRVAGLVVDKVDRIMHGMELGSAGMHNQVRQWAGEGFIAGLLELLVNRGYRVLLTADHGNVEALGIGSPAEGASADLRAARVRVYSDGALRGQVQAHFPGAIAWPPTGLPQGYLPLLAPGRSAFIAKGQRTVAHGGLSVEEAIVPLIEIEARGR
ncbi:MAG TPA: BREX-3 system phosphatase PglZ, partial [Anaerolineae bacterium]|nr:BREX-3 system phosphatase PglZ [Anaerolineae bacterium]